MIKSVVNMDNNNLAQQTHDVDLNGKEETEFQDWMEKKVAMDGYRMETGYPEILNESLQKVPNNMEDGRLRTIFRIILEDLSDGDKIIEEILSKEGVNLTPTPAFVKDIADMLFDWHYPIEILYIDLPLYINVLAKIIFTIITCNRCSNLRSEYDARNRIKKIFKDNEKVIAVIQNSFDAELRRKIEDSKKIGLSDLGRFLQKDMPENDKPLSLGRVVMLNFETFKEAFSDDENITNEGLGLNEPKAQQFKIFKDKKPYIIWFIGSDKKDITPEEIVDLGKHKNGRTLCRILLEDVVNGHKLVLKMLDNLVVPVFNDKESIKDREENEVLQSKKPIDFNRKDVSIKVKLLQVQGDDYPLQVVRDLLDIQSVRGSNDKLSEILKHPVIQILILTVWKSYIWKHALRARFVALFVICFTAFVRLRINEYRHIDDCGVDDSDHDTVYDWPTCYDSSFRDYEPHNHTNDNKNVDFYIKHYGLHDSIFSCSSFGIYGAHMVLCLLFIWHMFGFLWSLMVSIRWFYNVCGDENPTHNIRTRKTKLLIQIFNLVTLTTLVFLCSNRCRLMLGITFLWGALVARGGIKVFVMVIMPVLAGKGDWTSFLKEMAKKSFWSDPENYLELMCYIAVPFALFHDITGSGETVEINRGLVAAGVCCAWLQFIFILGLPSTSAIGDFITMFYNVIKIKLWFYMKVFFLLVIGFGFSFWFLNESQNGNTCFKTNIRNVGQNVCQENNIANHELCGQDNTIYICRPTLSSDQPQMKALECSKSNNTVCFSPKTATARVSRRESEKKEMPEMRYKSVHYILQDFNRGQDIDNNTGDSNNEHIGEAQNNTEEDSNYIFQSIDNNFAIFKNTCPTNSDINYLDVYLCPEEDDKVTFNGFWKSLLMTITLSIGEFNISDFTKLFNGHETTQIFAMVFLIMLITLASISMINLLIGAIISDYKQIKEDAAKQNLMFMAEYIIFCEQAGKLCDDVLGFARRRLIKKPYIGSLVKMSDKIFEYIKRMLKMGVEDERVFCPHEMCHTKQGKKHTKKDWCEMFTCQEKSKLKNCHGQSLKRLQSKRYTYEVGKPGDKTEILDKLIALATKNHKGKNEHNKTKNQKTKKSQNEK